MDFCYFYTELMTFLHFHIFSKTILFSRFLVVHVILCFTILLGTFGCHNTGKTLVESVCIHRHNLSE